MAEPIRIANCSGFYGDRLSAAAEMVEDGPIDVLTGDWLAELTMLILARTRSRRPGGGYARSFVKQMEQVMGACLESGIKVVSNAGGLDPRGCAQAVADVAERLGLSPRIACVDGDDLMGRLSRPVNPRDPAPGHPLDPATGHADDPPAGRPGGRATGHPRHARGPATGHADDPATGHADDPATGNLDPSPGHADTAPGHLLDPPAGRPGDPATGHPRHARDPATGRPGDPAAGHPRHARGPAAGDVVLQPFDIGGPLPDPARLITANAYLGCWGIVEALRRGADIVVTGRVTDAAVACGPAAWHHGWADDDWDALAGAVVAGHVIECGTQATGGNYSFFTEFDGMARTGFPWAEIAADGSSLIGKHDGTGGAVTVGTVTAQLLYEIDAPAYLGPDVTARFDTIRLSQAAPDRVRIDSVRGEPPPPMLKVATNELGGYRSQIQVALTGLDIAAKAALVRDAFWRACPHSPGDYAKVVEQVVRTDKPDPPTNEEAAAVWCLTVFDHDEAKLGRTLSDAMNELALATIPGFCSPGSAARPRAFGVYRPALVPAALVPQHVTFLDGEQAVVDPLPPSPNNIATTAGNTPTTPDTSHPAPSMPPHTPTTPDTPAQAGVIYAKTATTAGNTPTTPDTPTGPGPARRWGPTAPAPLGRVAGARSGDKGGNANLGLFTRTGESFEWLDGFLTVQRLRELLPETAPLRVDRHRLANIWSLNFVIHGLLGDGVAASDRQDPQAKSLGEWLRARVVDIPQELLA